MCRLGPERWDLDKVTLQRSFEFDSKISQLHQSSDEEWVCREMNPLERVSGFPPGSSLIEERETSVEVLDPGANGSAHLGRSQPETRPQQVDTLIYHGDTHVAAPCSPDLPMSTTSPGWVSFTEYVNDTWTRAQQRSQQLGQTLPNHLPTLPLHLPRRVGPR